jgi:benzil reductase ((S)-benzoin forming)
MSASAAAPKPLAIVSGCSRGLGLAIAKKLHEKGFDVLGVARSDPPHKDTMNHCYNCDLSQPEQVEKLFHNNIKGHMAGRDRVVLVNNAGSLGPIGPTSLFGDDAEGSVRRLDATIRLNVTTPMWLSGAVLREAGEEAAVRIINISSGAAGNAYPGWSAYCTSKAALRMSGQVLAVDAAEFDELKGRDVRVFDYAPVSQVALHACVDECLATSENINRSFSNGIELKN